MVPSGVSKLTFTFTVKLPLVPGIYVPKFQVITPKLWVPPPVQET